MSWVSSPIIPIYKPIIKTHSSTGVSPSFETKFTISTRVSERTKHYLFSIFKFLDILANCFNNTNYFMTRRYWEILTFSPMFSASMRICHAKSRRKNSYSDIIFGQLRVFVIVFFKCFIVGKDPSTSIRIFLRYSFVHWMVFCKKANWSFE